jgi:hypothetical protein
VLKPALTTLIPVLFAIYIPTCAPAIRPTMMPKDVQMAELWEAPTDLATRNLYDGTWGKENAPDPTAVYRFVARKETGTNPGVTVQDPAGREWHIKQPPHNNQGAEGPIEVTLSRVLAAVGYHQPPVYFLPTFTLTQGEVTGPEPGGRFRLDDKSVLKKVGEWSWQQNPFVGTKPYQGLLVILMIFNSSDIKNENNTLYELKKPTADAQHWYVVRDLGTALGETGKLTPHRGDPDLFDRHKFATGIENGFVRFEYHGWHKELIKHRITPADVKWACELLSGLSDTQWADAFRAGGYEPQLAQRFITRVHQKIREGLQLEAATVPAPTAAQAAARVAEPVAVR